MRDSNAALILKYVTKITFLQLLGSKGQFHNDAFRPACNLTPDLLHDLLQKSWGVHILFRVYEEINGKMAKITSQFVHFIFYF